MKTLALSELRRVAERTRLVRRTVSKQVDRTNNLSTRQLVNLSTNKEPPRQLEECIERIPWRVWYVAASNGDVILGEECVTVAVYPEAGSRLVQFTSSGATRRLRDCCILQADDFILRV